MSEALDRAGFCALLDRLAAAWAAQDPDEAAACFTLDAVYQEPPDQQLFRGRGELRAYFSPLAPGTYLDIHGRWFDESTQSGAAEFSFGVRGGDTADHGVAVIQVRDGLIDNWREYPRPGPADFGEFTAIGGKRWTWHAGNYP